MVAKGMRNKDSLQLEEAAKRYRLGFLLQKVAAQKIKQELTAFKKEAVIIFKTRERLNTAASRAQQLYLHSRNSLRTTGENSNRRLARIWQYSQWLKSFQVHQLELGAALESRAQKLQAEFDLIVQKLLQVNAREKYCIAGCRSIRAAKNFALESAELSDRTDAKIASLIS